ncbi:hypothetical protein DPMN_111176 [Dreissena polymorpha]|uniref:Uncharacterized protein n=1 Tax=Dreissena polymorpha TaxID=45954 RepID=A0A9D4KDY7_DREPO|nr:hypothetical protein DPMN_111176 [Dreissena polymorpha]
MKDILVVWMSDNNTRDWTFSSLPCSRGIIPIMLEPDTTNFYHQPDTTNFYHQPVTADFLYHQPATANKCTRPTT